MITAARAFMLVARARPWRSEWCRRPRWPARAVPVVPALACRAVEAARRRDLVRACVRACVVDAARAAPEPRPSAETAGPADGSARATQSAPGVSTRAERTKPANAFPG